MSVLATFTQMLPSGPACEHHQVFFCYCFTSPCKSYLFKYKSTCATFNKCNFHAFIATFILIYYLLFYLLTILFMLCYLRNQTRRLILIRQEIFCKTFSLAQHCPIALYTMMKMSCTAKSSNC